MPTVRATGKTREGGVKTASKLDSLPAQQEADFIGQQPRSLPKHPRTAPNHSRWPQAAKRSKSGQLQVLCRRNTARFELRPQAPQGQPHRPSPCGPRPQGTGPSPGASPIRSKKHPAPVADPARKKAELVVRIRSAARGSRRARGPRSSSVRGAGASRSVALAPEPAVS